MDIAFTVASVWFCFAAARALGKQWALMARVIEGHELIRQGPYAVVRNPIYLAMLGMLIATGMAVSRWSALVCAAIVFAAGTAIRIRAEENLLRQSGRGLLLIQAFVDEFDLRRREPSGTEVKMVKYLAKAS